jgi:cytochrome c-type biogenesis protein CcmH
MQFSSSSQAMNAEREDMKKMQASLQESIDKLEEKLKKNPNDVEGMALLARSYFVLENYAAAARVLERLVQLRPRDPDAMADLADSLAASSPERTLAGRPISLVKAALAVNPRHPKSLALAATYAMQTNQTAEAISYWKRLRALMPPDSEQQQRVDAILASMGVAPETATSKSAKNDAVGNANKTITGTITLAPAIIAMAREGKLPADAVVFILARVAGSSGGPPLAALRVPLAQVLAQAKYAFKLDDSLSMNPANKLSDAKLVDVEARIAIGGSVQKQAGDIRVIVKDVKPGQRALNLTLEPQS